MQRIFGYCRISKPTQNIEYQERNIISEYPTARIYKEAYTGTKIQGRKELDKILRQVQSGDTIVFDGVSRMSRNAAEGVELYMQLYDKGIELVFLKDPTINTSIYREKMMVQVAKIESTGSKATDKLIDAIMTALHDYMVDIATEQIERAFERAQKEVDDIHKRTADGIETARRNGKQIGQRKGAKLKVKKAAAAKKIIKTSCKSFGGTLTDEQCAAAAGISRKTYYKYKSEIRQEMDDNGGLQMEFDE